MQHNTDTANSCMTIMVDSTVTSSTTAATAATVAAAAAAATAGAAAGSENSSEHADLFAYSEYSVESHWPHTQCRDTAAAGSRCDYCTQGECRLYPLLPTVDGVLGAARRCALQALHNRDVSSSSSNSSRAMQQFQQDSVYSVRTPLCEVKPELHICFYRLVCISEPRLTLRPLIWLLTPPLYDYVRTSLHAHHAHFVAYKYASFQLSS
jgi:hypothetical protein